MADIEGKDITLNDGTPGVYSEKVWRARQNIADCLRATGHTELCPVCLERIAAIAALETESPAVPVSPSVQDENHGK